MKFRSLFVFLFFASLRVQAAEVIMLMGPSCAGKSTLSKYLCAELNAQNEIWKTVDFDDVEENIELLITTISGWTGCSHFSPALEPCSSQDMGAA